MKTKLSDVKMFVSDLDGTLLNSIGLISEENSNALNYFVNTGKLFTIATGRMKYSVDKYLHNLPINAPAILCNGAVIYDFTKDEVIWQNTLTDECKKIVPNLMNMFPDAGIEIYTDTNIYFVQQNVDTDYHKAKIPVNPIVTNVASITESWYKVILAWSAGNLKAIVDYVNEQDYPLECIYSEHGFLELLPKGVSKGKALERLMKILEVSNFEVAAVGDNLNDMDMLQGAGIAIAVDNAHEDIKNIADICCCTNDQNVFSDILELLHTITIS